MNSFHCQRQCGCQCGNCVARVALTSKGSTLCVRSLRNLTVIATPAYYTDLTDRGGQRQTATEYLAYEPSTRSSLTDSVSIDGMATSNQDLYHQDSYHHETFDFPDGDHPNPYPAAYTLQQQSAEFGFATHSHTASVVPHPDEQVANLPKPIDITEYNGGFLDVVGTVHVPGPSNDMEFRCLHPNCGDTTFGRWQEFARHYNGAHAARPTVYWCHVVGCSRSNAGNNKSFPRKDKRDEHVSKRHPSPVYVSTL